MTVAAHAGDQVRAQVLGWHEARADDTNDPSLPTYTGVPEWVEGKLVIERVSVPQAGIRYTRHRVGLYDVDPTTISEQSMKSRIVREFYRQREQAREANGQFGAGDSSGKGGGASSLQSAMSAVPITGNDDFDRASWASEGKTPEEVAARQELQRFAETWSSNGGYAEQVREVAANGPTDMTDGRVIQGGEFLGRALDNAPVFDGVMYRGVKNVDTPAVGHVMELGPSSFTTSKDQANGYAGHAFLGHGIVLHVEGGARAVPLGDLSMFEDEKELISAGRFEVTSTEDISSGRTVVNVRQL